MFASQSTVLRRPNNEMATTKKTELDSDESLASEPLTGRNVDAVMQFILDRIRTGEYAQGQPLVARDIARRVGVSVAPVREALHRLWGEGIVEFHSNRSARVRRLSRDDVLHASEVWEVHGGLMARLAAERIKIDDNAERVRAASAAMVDRRRRLDPASYFHALMKYQDVLAEIGGNPYVMAVKKRLHTEFWTPASVLYIPDAAWTEYLDSFVRVNTAILEGEPQEAESEYRRHVRFARSLLRRHLPKDLHLLVEPPVVSPAKRNGRSRRASQAR